MKKALLILICCTLLGALAFAHGDMEHVVGTVVALTDHSVSVKAADGSVKVVAFDNATRFLKGDAGATVKDVRVGGRVVIHARKHGNDLLAAEIRIGADKPAARPL